MMKVLGNKLNVFVCLLFQILRSAKTTALDRVGQAGQIYAVGGLDGRHYLQCATSEYCTFQLIAK